MSRGSHWPRFAMPRLRLRGSRPRPGAESRRRLIPDINQRSGLRTRMTPIIPNLPPDPDRDIYQNYRWADTHEGNPIGPTDAAQRRALRPEVEERLHGECFTPYFAREPRSQHADAGLPGPSASSSRTFTRQFKPVDMYYSGGCFSPVYDLDAFVPGPGPYPFPRLFHRKPQGG